MKRVFTSRIAMRTGIILFWVSLILLFLYVPKFVERFAYKKILRIATWPLLIDAQYVRAFEKETGIELHFTYFERSEELDSK